MQGMFKNGVLVLSVSQNLIIVLPSSPMAMVSRTIIHLVQAKNVLINIPQRAIPIRLWDRQNTI